MSMRERKGGNKEEEENSSKDLKKKIEGGLMRIIYVYEFESINS
jgi:hypothetical protein